MLMQLIRGLYNIKREHRSCIATIGNFDGVHLGHKTILGRLCKEAQRRNAQSCVITFEPLPREYFGVHNAPARLSTLREKIFLLKQCGIDQVLCLPFDDKLSSIHANDFVKMVLVEGLGIQYLIVGDDFRFGYERSGCFANLCELGKLYGFDTCNARTVLLHYARISSSKIREALAASRLQEASQLLGHSVMMIGRVVRGNMLGQKLGFPTANINLGRHKVAIKGVFAVHVYFSGRCYVGVANIGIRPTIGVNSLLLEVHLLDFSEDLYGRKLRVVFIKKLRDESRFSSLKALSVAIAGDIRQARLLPENELTYV